MLHLLYQYQANGGRENFYNIKITDSTQVPAKPLRLTLIYELNDRTDTESIIHCFAQAVSELRLGITIYHPWLSEALSYYSIMEKTCSCSGKDFFQSLYQQSVVTFLHVQLFISNQTFFLSVPNKFRFQILFISFILKILSPI